MNCARYAERAVYSSDAVSFHVIWSWISGFSSTSCSPCQRRVNWMKCCTVSSHKRLMPLTQLFSFKAYCTVLFFLLLIWKIKGHVLWTFSIPLGYTFAPLPIVIFVAELQRRQSDFVQGTSIPNHGLLSEVQASHTHLILSALEKRWRSRIPSPPSLVGRRARFHKTLHLPPVMCVPPVHRKRRLWESSSVMMPFGGLSEVRK